MSHQNPPQGNPRMLAEHMFLSGTEQAMKLLLDTVKGKRESCEEIVRVDGLEVFISDMSKLIIAKAKESVVNSRNKK
jgi:hypothetical protein